MSSSFKKIVKLNWNIKEMHEPGVVANTSNPSTEEAGTGRSIQWAPFSIKEEERRKQITVGARPGSNHEGIPEREGEIIGSGRLREMKTKT